MFIIHSHFLTLPQDQICFANLVAGLGFEPKTFGLCLLLQLSLLHHESWRVCSLDYTFLRLWRRPAVSSLYTFSPYYRRTWLGITILKASPNLTGNLPLHCYKDAHVIEPDELPDCSTPQYYLVVFCIIGLYMPSVNAF